MINLDYKIRENISKHNLNWTEIPNYISIQNIDH